MTLAIVAAPRHYAPRIYVPGTRTLLLTEARKMPCNSWSLPARESCPFSVHTPGAICEFCYADNGNYQRIPTVKAAQRRRYEWAKRCMRSGAGRREFIDTLAPPIAAAPYFRVHDSGDFFSPIYTATWGEIARLVPDTRLWIPTRSHRALVAQSPMAAYWREAFDFLLSAPNVTVRPSADDFEDPAPLVAGFAAGTSASEHHYTCPASHQGNRCADCRTCFDDPDVPVIYHARFVPKARRRARGLVPCANPRCLGCAA